MCSPGSDLYAGASDLYLRDTDHVFARQRLAFFEQLQQEFLAEQQQLLPAE